MFEIRTRHKSATLCPAHKTCARRGKMKLSFRSVKRDLFLICSLIFFVSTQVSFAQSFNVNLSPKHVAKINQAKSGQKKLAEYRKYFSKDSARQSRKENKTFRKRFDSLARANRKNEKLQHLAEKNGVKSPIDTLAFLNQYASLIPKDSVSMDSLGNKGLYVASEALSKQLGTKYGFSTDEIEQYKKGDSAARKKLIMKSLVTAKDKSIAQLPAGQQKQLQLYQKEYGPYSTEAKQYLVFLKDSVDRSDTIKMIASRRAEALATKMVDQKLGGQMGQLNDYSKKMEEIKNMPKDYQKQLDDYKDPEKLKEAGMQKGKEQAMDHFAGQADKLQTVQGKMLKLKGKFSTLLNSNDPKSGIKEKSLSGRPIRERWVIGGNFNIPSTAPLMLDLSPQFGYRIDKKFQLGIGGIYRATFTDSVKVMNAPPADMYGYTAFSSYGLILNFFAYGEFQRTNAAVKNTGSMIQSVDPKLNRQWTNSLLIGIGRQFVIHPKVRGSILLLYNPLHENGKTPYQDAFIVKTGFQLSELALLKK